MKDTELYAAILGLSAPWHVDTVRLQKEEEEVHVHVSARPGTQFECPECRKACPGYDTRSRRWRHLDTCQLKTILIASVPRIECPEHGVVTVGVPWAEPRSGFTALFEALVIDWLHESSTLAVSRQLRLSWNAIDGMKQRAVRRGMQRRAPRALRHIGVDETAFRKRHDYVTVVSDSENGTVVHVGEGRGAETLSSWYESQPAETLQAIESVSMDMWKAYIGATLSCVPEAKRKIAFDKFHVAHNLGDAVDRVRRSEHKLLSAEGRKELKRSRFLWLYHPENLPDKYKSSFNKLRNSALLTAEAWAIKTAGMSLWKYTSRTWAEKAWRNWIDWALSTDLKPIHKAAKTIESHLWGILNAVVLKVTNGPAEGLNSRIKSIKVRCRGFRNKQRFANDIYFHLGGLKLYPDAYYNNSGPL